MSREALHMSFGGPDALEAFAAVMLGEHPFEPSEEATTLARLAQELSRGRERPLGDLRALYGLAREHSASAPKRRHDPEKNETKPARSLRLLLGLRHRQRAALALRYLAGLGTDDVASVLGVSRSVADEVVRGGLAAIARAAGSKMDVRRSLRSLGGSPPRTRQASGPAAHPASSWSDRAEPRSVFRLLLAPPPAGGSSGVAERAAGIDRVVFAARPVYGTPLAEAAATVPPSSGRDRAGRAGRDRLRAWAAAAAAIVVLAALALSPHGAFVARAPLAVVPLAPRISAPAPRVVPAAPAASVYLVRRGDTLWSIAARSLGDPYRWREIWRANAGKIMRGGARFTHPDLIMPGWALAVPSRRPAPGGG